MPPASSAGPICLQQAGPICLSSIPRRPQKAVQQPQEAKAPECGSSATSAGLRIRQASPRRPQKAVHRPASPRRPQKAVHRQARLWIPSKAPEGCGSARRLCIGSKPPEGPRRLDHSASPRKPQKAVHRPAKLCIVQQAPRRPQKAVHRSASPRRHPRRLCIGKPQKAVDHPAVHHQKAPEGCASPAKLWIVQQAPEGPRSCGSFSKPQKAPEGCASSSKAVHRPVKPQKALRSLWVVQ